MLTTVRRCYPNPLTSSSPARLVLLLLAVASIAVSQAPRSPVLLNTLSEELNRNYTALKQKAEPSAYFLSYEVYEQEFRSIEGTLGTIESNNAGKNRILDVSVRVGTPQLDNYHRVRGEQVRFTSGALLSYEDSVNALKRRLWLETDRAYRGAAERLIRIKTNTQVKVAAEDDSDDFSHENVSTYEAPSAKLQFEEAAWSARIRNLSSRFGNYPEILTSHVAVTGDTDTRYFVNTEGTRVQHGRGYARVVISAAAKAQDGTDLQTGETFESVDPSGLPKDDVLIAAVDRVAKDLV